MSRAKLTSDVRPDIKPYEPKKPAVPRADGGITNPNIRTTAEENRQFILHDMALLDLGKVDFNNPDAVRDRVRQYLTICADSGIRPCSAGLALALGETRRSLMSQINGSRKTLPLETVEVLQMANAVMNAQLEHTIDASKINPATAIFLMKNNHGYRDVTDISIETTTKIEQVDRQVLEAQFAELPED